MLALGDNLRLVNVVTNEMVAQEAAIEQARLVLATDERVRALWLQGSFGRGDADPWSDVDCHAAIADESFGEFSSDMTEILGRIAPVVGSISVALGATRLVASTLGLAEGLVRFDLYAQPVARAGESRQQFVVLFDRDGVTERFVVGPIATADALRRRVEGLISNFFFGAMWPVRLAGRGTHGTLLLNAISVVYQFIVPAILVRTRPEEAFREVLHVEHWLHPDDRQRIDQLLSQLHASFTGLGEHDMDASALASLHGLLIGTALTELRQAAAVIGIPWPEHSERAYRAYYRRELGIEL